MNQEAFNYWYNNYAYQYKCYPPSMEHFFQYVHYHVPYYNQFNTPLFIPIQQTQSTPPILENTNKKEKCADGMECKNVYCKYFHHPGTDSKIFLNK